MSGDDMTSWFTGTAVTEHRADELERHLRMLQALRVEIELVRPGLLPDDGADGWRSTAAHRYVERVALLRREMHGVESALVDAEAGMRAEVERMRGVLADRAEREAAERAGGSGRAGREVSGWASAEVRWTN